MMGMIGYLIRFLSHDFGFLRRKFAKPLATEATQIHNRRYILNMDHECEILSMSNSNPIIVISVKCYPWFYANVLFENG